VKLGLLTVLFGDWPLERVAGWAKENGFEAREIACWPATSGEARRYVGVTHIDVDSVEERADEIRSLVDGLEASGLGYYPNNLHPGPEHRVSVNEHTRKVIRAAPRLGVPVVNTFVGRDKDRTHAEKIAEFRKVWPAIVDEPNRSGRRWRSRTAR
jgi:sugar phosphate isomerase/epimerase